MSKLAGGSKSTVKAGGPQGPQGEYLDTLAGLKGLGYAEEEVRSLIIETFEAEPDLDAAGAIRVVLKKIAAARS